MAEDPTLLDRSGEQFRLLREWEDTVLARKTELDQASARARAADRRRRNELEPVHFEAFGEP